MSSTSNIKVAIGGITPPATPILYPSSGGIIGLRFPPTIPSPHLC